MPARATGRARACTARWRRRPQPPRPARCPMEQVANLSRGRAARVCHDADLDAEAGSRTNRGSAVALRKRTVGYQIGGSRHRVGREVIGVHRR
eukprot:scaffold3425_cov65-Phaeocystis_antarctica.AAC.3